MAVVMHFLVFPALYTQILKDHGFMIPAAKGFTQRKGDHGKHKSAVSGREIKDDKGNDIKYKRQYHGTTTAEGISDHTRGDLKDIHGNFPNCIQGAYGQETQAFFQEEQNQESFEETQVL